MLADPNALEEEASAEEAAAEEDTIMEGGLAFAEQDPDDLPGLVEPDLMSRGYEAPPRDEEPDEQGFDEGEVDQRAAPMAQLPSPILPSAKEVADLLCQPSAISALGQSLHPRPWDKSRSPADRGRRQQGGADCHR